MWINPRKYGEDCAHKDYPEGLYIFGGMNSDGEVMNDLWVARPNYKQN